MADDLLSIARKQLQPEIDAEIDKAYKNHDDVVYHKGYDKGKYDARKEIPCWRKVEADVEYPTCLTREMDVNGDYQYCLSSGRIYDVCEYILLAELELKLKREGE